MSILETGTKGKKLRDIIAELGNKSYPFIECRCKWTDENGDNDEFFGGCSYDAKTGELKPLDGDTYSLDDLYEEYEEWVDDEEGLLTICLTVWEYGVVKGK